MFRHTEFSGCLCAAAAGYTAGHARIARPNLREPVHIDFTKMHGAGNDFVVIDARGQTLELNSAQAQHLADRHLGIGCDQILVLHDATTPRADFAYRIYNAAGGEVQQCGNGARALALFARPDAPADITLRMQSPAGLVQARFSDNGQVSVDMGPAHFSPDALPFVQTEQKPFYELAIDGQPVTFGAVSMGNPHAVLVVDDIDRAPVAKMGTALQNHCAFPQSVNVGFMYIHSRRHIDLRVFERGVGETLACGTGACAAVAIGVARGDLDTQVDVTLPGGQLMVNCAQIDQAIWLTGPAHRAFTGHIDL